MNRMKGTSTKIRKFWHQCEPLYTSSTLHNFLIKANSSNLAVHDRNCQSFSHHTTSQNDTRLHSILIRLWKINPFLAVDQAQTSCCSTQVRFHLLPRCWAAIVDVAGSFVEQFESKTVMVTSMGFQMSCSRLIFALFAFLCRAASECWSRVQDHPPLPTQPLLGARHSRWWRQYRQSPKKKYHVLHVFQQSAHLGVLCAVCVKKARELSSTVLKARWFCSPAENYSFWIPNDYLPLTSAADSVWCSSRIFGRLRWWHATHGSGPWKKGARKRCTV